MPKRLTPRGQPAPPVEPIITGATMAPKPAEKTRARPKAGSKIKYVRNLHHIRSRVTLANGREIQLAPRGQREDTDVVNEQEQLDPKFLANRDLIFEVIEVADAEAIIAKQQTNTRRQENTLWDHLRNAQGDAYDQRAATIEEVFEQQGYVVGQVSTPAKDGSSHSQRIAMTRAAGPKITEVPGSPGHPATELMQSIPSYVDPTEYHEFLLWKQFKEEQAAAKSDAS